jgi:hypothetical protein
VLGNRSVSRVIRIHQIHKIEPAAKIDNSFKFCMLGRVEEEKLQEDFVLTAQTSFTVAAAV